MTGTDAAPDVAALAAALETVHGSPSDFVWRPEAIIAALAAQGWRITSDSVFWDERAHEVSAQAAPDPDNMSYTDWQRVSAQAVPDPWAEAHKRSWTEDDCNAAVRAALEGLRAEVVTYRQRFVEEGDRDTAGRLKHVLALIDARLAALDA